MTTRESISDMFDVGEALGATHMIMKLDGFDYTDYPVYCFSDEECTRRLHDNTPMTRVLEVYDLSQDKEEQLSEHRCDRRPRES